MNESEFLEQWNREREMYRAWGAFVQKEIEASLSTVSSLAVDVFLKLPSTPRVKTDDSLIGKAFYSGKAYRDPYGEIEDKVGMRFVVLLTTDIRKIQDVIERSTSWVHSLDRDFEAEREDRPYEFSYQSKHYVLRAARDIEFEGAIITRETPCEVQLRTLLQHAHSELTHDNIYKRDSKTEVTKKVQRAVAKSMALIEAVDDYFLQAIGELDAATDLERSALSVLIDTYTRNIGVAPHNDKSSGLVLSAYRDELAAVPIAERIENFLAKHPYVHNRITDRAERLYMFRQPWIYLVYALVASAPIATARAWPLTPDELRPIYVDLGQRFPL